VQFWDRARIITISWVVRECESCERRCAVLRLDPRCLSTKIEIELAVLSVCGAHAEKGVALCPTATRV